jgi:Ca2+-binding EF-hand superfamily protein
MNPNQNNMPPHLQPMQPGTMPPNLQPMQPGTTPPPLDLQGFIPAPKPNICIDERHVDLTNHQMQTYNFDKKQIKEFGKPLFKKYDKDGSKTVNMNELPGLMNEFMASCEQPPINPNDLAYNMQLFDEDRSGFLDFDEFKMMLKNIGGHKKYDKHSIKEKKEKNKNKDKKDKKDKKEKKEKH